MVRTKWALFVVAPLALFGDVFGTSDARATTAMPAPFHAEELAQAEVVEQAQVPIPPLAPDTRMFAKLIQAVSHAHGVDAALVHAVILAESSYDPNAVSIAGASGLMQLMPETAKRLGVRDIFDPADNIRGGVKHLKQLLVLFDGDMELAIAAYNAGENAVIRAGNRIPPYPQTALYVPKVIGYYRSMQSRRE